MNQKIVQLALIVKEYDEAITFYTKALGFELLEDTPLTETKRWVIVKPKGTGSCAILLAKAANEQQGASIGNQTGGRVFLFLHTDDCLADYERLIKNGVSFIRHPEVQPYGTVAVFADLYGNLWDLIQPTQ